MSRVFDGSGSLQDSNNDKVLLAPHSTAYDNLRAFTRSAWIYLNGLGGSDSGVIIAKDIQGLTSPFLSLEEGTLSGKLSCYISTSSFFTTATTTINALSLHQWYHITFTFNADGDNLCHIYINGVEATYQLQLAGDGTIADDSGANTGDGQIYIGGDLLFHEWNGYIAEVAIWNTVLTSAQIATLAASSSGAAAIAPGNLRAYWHLCGKLSPEPDASGNGNSAVLSTHIPIKGPDSPGFNCSGNASPTPGCVYIGTYPGRDFKSAFPNPLDLDVAQVINEGGVVVWKLSSAGISTTNPTSWTQNALLYRIEGQSFANAFPNTYKQDLLHIENQSGRVVFALDWQGNTTTF